MMTSDIRVSRLMKVTFSLALAATIVIGLVDNVAAVSRWSGRADITDFHAFYLVGQLVWSGHFVEAYHASAMLALEEALGGRAGFIAWSYPPLFGAVVAALAALPLGAAFLLFGTATLAFYLWTIRRLDPEGFWPVMLSSTVGIILNLRCGQNGLLTAGVVAAAAALLLDRSSVRSGLCLALMAIKPHLIPLLPLALVMQRRWLALGVAALGALALTGLSIALFGLTVFAAFLHGLSDVGRLMALGAYPLHRMTSVFAFCIGIGLPFWAAALLHGGVAILVLAAAARLTLRHPDPRLQLGLAVMAGFFISPYVYDYDLVLFGIGLILVSPALQARVSVRRYAAILSGYAVIQCLGLGLNVFADRHQDVVLAPAGPAMVALFCFILWPLRRAGLNTAAGLPSADPRPASEIEAKAA